MNKSALTAILKPIHTKILCYQRHHSPPKHHLLALSVTLLLGQNLFAQSAGATSRLPEQTITLGIAQEQHTELSRYNPIISEAFSRANIALKIVSMPGNRATHDANAGNIDGETVLTEFLNFRYTELVPIKVPLATVYHWVIVHGQRDCPASISDLYRLTSVSILGAVVHSKTREFIGGPNITVRSPMALLQVLHTERGDYTIVPLEAAKRHSNKHKIPIKPCFDRPFLISNLYTYLNKRHAHLIPKLEASYAQVIKEQIPVPAATP